MDLTYIVDDGAGRSICGDDDDDDDDGFIIMLVGRHHGTMSKARRPNTDPLPLLVSPPELEDLQNLERLSTLTSLDLSHNRISDISNLRHLTGLRELNLSSNQM